MAETRAQYRVPNDPFWTQGALAKGARNASARSRDVRSQRSFQRAALITKTFFMAKDPYLIGTSNFRDHGVDQ
jgi:hypothetical protein